MRIQNLQEADFENVIRLGNKINGDNYLNHEIMTQIFSKSRTGVENCSFVMYDDTKLVGFRLTYAPGKWEPDKWCSPDRWQVEPNELCYFKSNMIDPDYQGLGYGPMLLDCSIRVAKRLGAVGGITHIWMQSPGNAAFKYFTKAGGEVVMIHPDRWNEDCINYGYDCILCGRDCHCDAAEMVLYFKENK